VEKTEVLIKTYCLYPAMAFAESWEISIIELANSIGRKYKVTRRLPGFSVSETKVFRNKDEAKKQFDEWIALQ